MSDSVRHPLFARLYSKLLVPTMAKQGGAELLRKTLSAARCPAEPTARGMDLPG